MCAVLNAFSSIKIILISVVIAVAETKPHPTSGSPVWEVSAGARWMLYFVGFGGFFLPVI